MSAESLILNLIRFYVGRFLDKIEKEGSINILKKEEKLSSFFESDDYYISGFLVYSQSVMNCNIFISISPIYHLTTQRKTKLSLENE